MVSSRPAWAIVSSQQPESNLSTHCHKQTNKKDKQTPSEHCASYLNQCLMAYACHSSIPEAYRQGHQEFEVSPGYIVRAKTTWARVRSCLNQTKQMVGKQTMAACHSCQVWLAHGHHLMLCHLCKGCGSMWHRVTMWPQRQEQAG